MSDEHCWLVVQSHPPRSTEHWKKHRCQLATTGSYIFYILYRVTNPYGCILQGMTKSLESFHKYFVSPWSKSCRKLYFYYIKNNLQVRSQFCKFVTWLDHLYPYQNKKNFCSWVQILFGKLVLHFGSCVYLNIVMMHSFLDLFQLCVLYIVQRVFRI